MIPKIIHYCWFGGGQKSEIIEKCIESWYKYCPDWEIIEWNELNYDVNKIPFMKEAYESKKWAFVSDYARLDIVYSMGGVYLDTDVELVESMDEWLEESGFVVFETSRMVNTGQGFGAVKGHDAILKMIKKYENLHCMKDGRFMCYTCPKLNTEALVNYCNEFTRNGMTQDLNGFKVWSMSEYSKKAVHHYTGTWGDEKSKSNCKYKETKWRKILRHQKNFKFIEKYFGKRILDIYTFLAYDLIEYGVLHYCKRFLSKICRRKKE